MDRHLIIAGGGRVGAQVADVLLKADLPFVVIEFDSRRVDLLKEKGYPVINRNAGQSLIMEAAGLEKARLFLITTPALVIVGHIISFVRKQRPDLHIVTRS